MRQSSSSNDKFLRMLSSSLHGLAQPLSIIHGYLEISLEDGASVEQYRELTKMLLQQSRRAAGIARFVSQLTRLQQPATDLEELRLSLALEGTIEEMAPALQAAGIKLVFQHAVHERLVKISQIRLRQVLSYILDAIRTASASGDVIRIDLTQKHGHVVLQIHRDPVSGSLPKVASSAEETNGVQALALADAIVTIAGGKFTGSLEPLFVRVEFPTVRQPRNKFCEKSTAGLGSTKQAEIVH